MNPVLRIKPVKVPPSPTPPFEEEQMAAILAACDRYPIMGIYNHGNRQRMKTLTLLMRYSGLRIGDAVTCARDRLVGSKLFLYQAKTGTPVYCPIPPIVVEALSAVEGQNPKYFFWTGNDKPKSAVADAQLIIPETLRACGGRWASAYVPGHVRCRAAEKGCLTREPGLTG
jgi:integrase/recombinase XerD